MKTLKNYVYALLFLFITAPVLAQDDQDTDQDDGRSNIQKFTPSKLIGKGQVDLKFFNNLFTQTESTFVDGDIPRENFFTTTFEAFFGVGAIGERDINIGLIAQFRSNTVGDQGIFDVFNFSGDENSRSGLTHIAPSIRIVPFPKLSKSLSYQTALFIPLLDNEVENGVFLAQDSFIWQNRYFFDYVFPGDKWQFFAELNTEYSFGSEAEFDANGNQIDGSFANNSLRLIPAVVFSYFPSSNFTITGLLQHSQLLDFGNDFTQNFTAVGGGVKFQLSKELNLEFLYTNFVRGDNTGLGESYNIGLRAIL